MGSALCQYSLLEVDHLYLDHVGRDSFYGSLVLMRCKPFKDEEFAEVYCLNSGHR